MALKLDNNYFTTKKINEISINNIDKDEISKKLQNEIKKINPSKESIDQLLFFTDMIQSTINDNGFQYFTSQSFNQYSQLEDNKLYEKFLLLKPQIEYLAAHKNNYSGTINLFYKFTNNTRYTNHIIELRDFLINLKKSIPEETMISDPKSVFPEFPNLVKEYMDLSTCINASMVNKSYKDSFQFEKSSSHTYYPNRTVMLDPKLSRRSASNKEKIICYEKDFISYLPQLSIKDFTIDNLTDIENIAEMFYSISQNKTIKKLTIYIKSKFRKDINSFMDNLEKLKNIQELELIDFPINDSLKLGKIVEQLPNLKYLKIGAECKYPVNAPMLNSLDKLDKTNLSNLHTLDLSECMYLNDIKALCNNRSQKLEKLLLNTKFKTELEKQIKESQRIKSYEFDKYNGFPHT